VECPALTRALLPRRVLQFMGVCYYSLMYMILDSVPEVAITVERKAVFYKQRDNNFFPAWSYALPLMLMDLPILFLEVLPYCILVYWIAGFAATAGQVRTRAPPPLFRAPSPLIAVRAGVSRHQRVCLPRREAFLSGPVEWSVWPGGSAMSQRAVWFSKEHLLPCCLWVRTLGVGLARRTALLRNPQIGLQWSARKGWRGGGLGSFGGIRTVEDENCSSRSPPFTQFFMFILLHYLTIVYADSMYRALGAAAPDLVIGNAISSFILLITLVTSGFTIIKKDIPGWCAHRRSCAQSNDTEASGHAAWFLAGGMAGGRGWLP
jgi:ABC-2 type transporter